MVPNTQTKPTQNKPLNPSNGPAQTTTSPSETEMGGSRSQHVQTRGSESRGGLRRPSTGDTGLAPPGMFALNPFSIMQQMGDEISRLLEGFGMGQGVSPALRLTFVPHVEISEHDNEVVVYVDLPGVPEDNIRIEATQGALIIAGERQHREEENEQGILRSERTYGAFRRVIPLPDGVDPETATATFTDGVLEICLPVQQHRHQRIKITPRKAESRSESAAKEQVH